MVCKDDIRETVWCRTAVTPPDAVEMWLRDGVKDRYAAALTEPVPDELVLLAARLFH